MQRQLSIPTVLEQKTQVQDMFSEPSAREEKNKEKVYENAVSSKDIDVATLLKACGKRKDLHRGILIHAHILKRGLLEKSNYVTNALISMYAKSGPPGKAKELLTEFCFKEVVSWNALLTGYTQQGLGKEVLDCFEQMQQEGVSPDGVTFSCILKACGSIGAADKGEQIHDEIVRRGLLEGDVVLGTALVDMHARCGALAKAAGVLKELPDGNVESWNALITGYTQRGQDHEALECFVSMKCKGIAPDAVTFTCILKAYGSIGAIDKGEQIHDQIAANGLLGSNVVLGNSLVGMYAKCGALARARQVLDELPARDMITWNIIIAGYAQQEQGHDALKCFDCMQGEGFVPNSATLTCILKACGSIGALDKGEQIHDKIEREGLLEHSIVLGNALVDMYAKCGAFAKARRVLDELPMQDVVTWNALIGGYAQKGHGQDALNCLEEMESKAIAPNDVTFTCILKACGSLKVLDKGEQIHNMISHLELLKNNVVLGNALVDMYAKCGALAKAEEVLVELPERDVVSWNFLIAGYSEREDGENALHSFERMRREGHSPNAVTYNCILKACSSIGATDKGEQFHEEIARQGFLEGNIVLGNALVDMYAKCGVLAKAEKVLNELRIQDVISWNSLIAGYAQHGCGRDALDCFERMQSKGLSPDEVTFTCILKACGTIGDIDKGEQIHDEIKRLGLLGNNFVLGTALVDMYINCGALEKARRVLDELPVGDVISWSGLIAGYAQQDRGEEALSCFDAMQAKGIFPDEVTFISVVKSCGSIGAADKGKKIHDDILKQDLLGSNVVLGTALVDMYAKCGAAAKAQQVLRELATRNIVSWNALMAGYAQEGEGGNALMCFKQLQSEGLLPDAVTFLCVLNACSHAGFIKAGQLFFVGMSAKYHCMPDLDHVTCMVDMFGRAGQFDKVVAFIERMPFSDDCPAVWSALLGACQKRGEVNVGRWAFKHALQADNSASAYISMANIYAAVRMQEDAEHEKV